MCFRALVRCLLALFWIIVIPAAVVAEEPAITLKSGTLVDFEIVDHVNSKLSKIGDHFAIRLAEPLRIDGSVIVPAGTSGEGEVIHAARARAGGKAGELILTARYLEYAGQRIDLRSFRFGKSGDSNVTEGAVVAFVGGPLAYLVVGGEVDVPAGTRGNAKLKNDVAIKVGSSGSAKLGGGS